MSGAARRHDDGRRPIRRPGVRGRTRDDGLRGRPEGPGRGPDRVRRGVITGACGRRSSVCISVRARAPSISAPAAADDASHARVDAAVRAWLRGGSARRCRHLHRADEQGVQPRQFLRRLNHGATSMIRAMRRSSRASVDGDEPASDLMSSSAGRSVAKISSGVLIAAGSSRAPAPGAPTDRARGAAAAPRRASPPPPARAR